MADAQHCRRCYVRCATCPEKWVPTASDTALETLRRLSSSAPVVVAALDTLEASLKLFDPSIPADAAKWRAIQRAAPLAAELMLAQAGVDDPEAAKRLLALDGTDAPLFAAGPAIADEDVATMVCTMARFGGSFANSIGSALSFADHGNRAKLLAAFPELVAKYGPGSAMFDHQRAAERPAKGTAP